MGTEQRGSETKSKALNLFLFFIRVYRHLSAVGTKRKIGEDAYLRHVGFKQGEHAR